jgi:hypothetical protein
MLTSRRPTIVRAIRGKELVSQTAKPAAGWYGPQHKAAAWAAGRREERMSPVIKLASAAIALIGLRMLIVSTRRKTLLDRDPPTHPAPQSQVLVARWHSTVDGRLAAQWVADAALA